MATISRIFALDRRQVLGGEGLVAGEVVEEAVVDHRADGDLGAGIELLHRLGHDMRGVVPDQRQRARIVAGDDLDPRIRGDRIGEVGELAVERHRHRLLGERLGNALGDLAAGDAGGESREELSGKVRWTKSGEAWLASEPTRLSVIS